MTPGLAEGGSPGVFDLTTRGVRNGRHPFRSELFELPKSNDDDPSPDTWRLQRRRRLCPDIRRDLRKLVATSAASARISAVGPLALRRRPTSQYAP